MKRNINILNCKRFYYGSGSKYNNRMSIIGSKYNNRSILSLHYPSFSLLLSYNIHSFQNYKIDYLLTNNLNHNRYLSTKRNDNDNKYKFLCPYEILNISRNATQKEIKMAYFKEAKKNHPDLNPNDSQAKIKFQIIADAYSILSDTSKKREYDNYGRVQGYDNFGKASKNTSYQSYNGQRNDNYGNSNNYYHENAEEVFKRVQEDVDIIREAFQEYIDEMKSEFAYAMDCASRGDWTEVWNLAKTYKGVFIGIVFPAIIFLRFPALIAVAMRLAVIGSQLLFMGLVRSGNLEVTVNWLWRRIVALALEKRKRKR